MPDDPKTGPRERKPKCDDDQDPLQQAAVTIESSPDKAPEGEDNLRRRAEWFQRRRGRRPD